MVEKLKGWLPWFILVAVSAVMVCSFFAKNQQLQEIYNTVKILQAQKAELEQSNAALNQEIDAMKEKHAAEVSVLNEQIVEASLKVDQIKVASLEQVQAIRESVNKSWEQRFDAIEQEYFTALEKINAQQEEIVLRNRLIDTMSLQLRDWIDKDAERRALMDDCTASLAESIGLNEAQSAEIKRLSGRVKFWKIVGIVAGGYLVWRAVK